jgi:hypothetical protein
VLANAVNEKNRFLIPKNDEKLAKKQDFREQKNAPLGKKSRFFKKLSKNDGFNKFLAFISPTFDDSSDSPGQKKHLGQPDSIF